MGTTGELRTTLTTRETSLRREDFSVPQRSSTPNLREARLPRGVWKDIVNVDDYTQTLRMEKCL